MKKNVQRKLTPMPGGRAALECSLAALIIEGKLTADEFASILRPLGKLKLIEKPEEPTKK